MRVFDMMKAIQIWKQKGHTLFQILIAFNYPLIVNMLITRITHYWQESLKPTDYLSKLLAGHN